MPTLAGRKRSEGGHKPVNLSLNECSREILSRLAGKSMSRHVEYLIEGYQSCEGRGEVILSISASLEPLKRSEKKQPAFSFFVGAGPDSATSKNQSHFVTHYRPWPVQSED